MREQWCSKAVVQVAEDTDSQETREETLNCSSHSRIDDRVQKIDDHDPLRTAMRSNYCDLTTGMRTVPFMQSVAVLLD